MDIQIRKQLEQLEYIKDKLEYIEYSESLQCYVEKLNGIPTGVAAWVNGAFYGFEQAAKAQAIPDGFVVVPVQCPDPDFADMLFDELRKNAFGEFGDDLLIHLSDIDEEKIWDLMLEAAQEQKG